MSNVTLFSKITQAKNGKHLPLLDVLGMIKSGEWQNIVIAAREIFIEKGRHSEEYKDIKKNCPYFTPSGTFENRRISGLIKHSGFAVVDIDESKDWDKTRKQLESDKYTYACANSLSGQGLFILLKINPEEHRKVFNDLTEYYFQEYQIKIDPGISVARARTISFDPGLYLNEASDLFKLGIVKHPEKERLVKRPNHENDLSEYILGDFTEQEQINHAISLVEKHHVFEEGQRNKYIFRLACLTNRLGVLESTILSHISATYNGFADEARITVKSVYRTYKNEHGIDIRPKIIGRKDKGSRGANGSQTQVAENGQMTSTGSATKKGKHLANLQEYLEGQWDIRRNEVTRLVELDDVPLDDSFLNSLWFDCHSIGIDVSRDDVKAVLESSLFPSYHPIKEFLEREPYDPNQKSLIFELAKSVETPTYEIDQWYHLLRKWMVGAIANIYNETKSPLMLVMYGSQKVGKTWFFRNLLPKELENYYAENNLDKDEAQILSQKMIVHDDEFAGKSKKDYKKLKEMISKQDFTLRLPYAKMPCTMPRMATLSASSNENEILFDPTGNRRIIPVEVLSRNYDAFDGINKARLWREALYHYNEGFEYELTAEDIEQMNEKTTAFEVYTAEYEMLLKYFVNPYNEIQPGQSIKDVPHDFWSATEILNYLEHESGNRRLSKTQLGRELKRLGYGQIVKRVDGKPKRGYFIRQSSSVLHF